MASKPETKPTNEDGSPGDLSPHQEWVWLGKLGGWVQTKQPQADAVKHLED